MIAFKEKRQYGIIQMFLENGKIVFHPDGEPPISQFLPEGYRDYGGPALHVPNPPREGTPAAFRFVLKLVKKLGWKPVMPARFVWCEWGWELRIVRMK